MILKKFVQQALFIQGLGVCEGEIHVWFFDLAELWTSFARFQSWLSEEELVRAQAFRFERDRYCYSVFHGAVREVLADYLGVSSPKAINFLQRERGKPYLRGIEFNLSHTKDHAVLAVSSSVRLGVDIERARRTVDCVALAERFFHPKEVASLKAQVGLARRQAFYQYWTAKEAFVKAVGEGVMFGLSSFCVDIGASCIDWIAPEKNLNPQGWQLQLSFPRDQSIALVYESYHVLRVIFNTF